MTETINKSPNCRQRLDECLSVAHGHESALALALDLGDDIGGLVAAARLRQALFRARAALNEISVHNSALHSSAVLAFRNATKGMYDLLRRAHTHATTGAPDVVKLEQWYKAMRQSIPAGDSPYLADLDARGVDLTEARIFRVHVARCRFITDLCRASFIDAVIDASDFTYSNLRSTLWQRTRVQRSFLRDCSLVDATLDGSTFADCDLRGADLSVTGGQLTFGANTQFIRCDLRESNWLGRDLSCVTMVDCKVYGLAGLISSSPMQVTRGDMSPKGDDSQVTCGGGADPDPRAQAGVFGDGCGNEAPRVRAPDSAARS